MSDISTTTGTSTATGLQPYVQQEWSNGEEGQTPISAERLRHMEAGIGDLSKTLLDGRLPAYTVDSETAPAPCTPCILVVVDDAGLYQGTWMDDGAVRTQIGRRAGGDEEKYCFRPPATAHLVHASDYATITRHGTIVQLEGFYSLDPAETASSRDSLTIYWIKIPLSCKPTYDVYSSGVWTFNGTSPLRIEVMRTDLIGEQVYILGSRIGVETIRFNVLWMTDALSYHYGASGKMLLPSSAQTAGSSAMQEPASQAMSAQEQAPVRTLPAHATPEQAKDVHAPTVPGGAAQAAGTARHAQ